MTTTRVQTAGRPAPAAAELSAAQRAAVVCDARVVVVQGGPGAGKTETAVARAVRLLTQLRQDPAGLLVLAPGESRASAHKVRLARALASVRYPQSSIARATARVLPVRTPGPESSPLPGTPAGRWGCEADHARGSTLASRVSDAAEALSEALGLAARPDDAQALLLEAMSRLSWGSAQRRAGEAASWSEADWFRLGVGFVEETVRFARGEVLRRLRLLRSAPDPVAGLAGQLRRPPDVAARARELRAAVDRACRAGASERFELERLRGWIDVAAIDLVGAARREAVAAAVRCRLFDVARQLLAPDAATGRVPLSADDLALHAADALRGLAHAPHLIVDDAHDLTCEVLAQVRAARGGGSLFVTGDQRSASWRNGGRSCFRALLRDAGRAVVLLEAPRFGAGMGRFVNALGTRLWPPSEPGGYAPAISRCDFDRSAAAPVELWLVRRRVAAGADGTEHPEPIADARMREVRAVAAAVARLRAEGPADDVAVLVPDETQRAAVATALDAEGVPRSALPTLTVEEARGLEWSTVFVTGLDVSCGGPAPRRAWLDAETGLPVVWPRDQRGRRVWPFSSLLLAQQAAAARDGTARQHLFLAVARARTRLVLSGVTRDGVAGGDTCVAPVEWLRRQLNIYELRHAASSYRIGEAAVRLRIVEPDGEAPAVIAVTGEARAAN